MRYHIWKKSLAALISCMMLSVGTTTIPITGSAASNIITNSTFSSGISGWNTYKESMGACSLGAEDGQLALKISNTGKVSYGVQLYYDIVPLYQNGVYHLKYDISSTVDRTVEGMIQQNGGTYQSYTYKKLYLTSEPQTIDYTFTMQAETDIMAKLVFNCGYQGVSLDEHTIYLDNVSLELVDDSKVNYESIMPYEPSIVTNQIGYQPESEKIAVFRDVTDETTFSVVNADTNEIVLTGDLYGEKSNTSSDETDWFGDFSSITEPGTYYITCGDLDDSYSFEIADNVYNNVLNDSVKMLYLQRCGTEIKDNAFGHTACHNTLAQVYGTNDKIDVSGGWHDAGDYGRYVVPGAKAIADLLYAYAANPELYGDDLGIPESGNDIPDILDEVRYELEWMLKMQDKSGGVYHKVTCANFPGYVMPEYETAPLIVTPISTTATADFCASMAMAYEFYSEVDKTFAEKCLEAAKQAWAFLEENPNMIFKNPEDITTGDYGDSSDKDERYWAAAQMYRATGEEVYLTALKNMTVRTGMDWTTVGDYGNIAIVTMEGIDETYDVYTKAKNAIVSEARKFASTTNNNAYGVAISSFNWGSNMTVANAGVILGLAYQLTGEDTYKTASASNLNYLLGRNPNGVCYVTGYGTVSPQNPHHRPSMAKKKAMKGMLVGGVNSNLEDSAAKAYLINTPSAKRYVDHSESYSTNEITIYWNSPFTYLLSLQPKEMPMLKGDVNLDGTVSVSDAVLLQKYLVSMTPLDKEQASRADLSEDQSLNVIDLCLLKQMLLQNNNYDIV